MFLDTSGPLCYLHRDELLHAAAVRLFDSSRKKLTHNYVPAEFVALAAARRLPRHAALALAADILAHPDIEVVWVDEALHRSAMNLLLSRSDKSYSLCDAVSFRVMKDAGFEAALTTDHHFEQEGFRRMLVPAG